MKILDELYYGNISGGDRTAYDREELTDLLSLVEKNRHLLLAELTEEQKDRFDKICCGLAEQRDLIDRHSFLTGFRLGVRMMAECFANNE
ncbi:MAG: hypothetical protein J6I42_04335 [Clostridia bacterium]|nr:hypothetical protein [Clostridia bacterium]MBO5127548.1 hypothetical protein [Clostridia bacterium]MBQ7312844.1 hypothetical protein [Clostridia bacterium]